jgi:hypothetical protein
VDVSGVSGLLTALWKWEHSPLLPDSGAEEKNTFPILKDAENKILLLS